MKPNHMLITAAIALAIVIGYEKYGKKVKG